jgi:hypothetical protein
MDENGAGTLSEILIHSVSILGLIINPVAGG